MEILTGIIQQEDQHTKHIVLPMVCDIQSILKVEEILHTKKNDERFSLRITLLTQPPRDYAMYHAHEFALKTLFQRIDANRCRLGLITCSSWSHSEMIENYSYDWKRFLENPIILTTADFEGWTLQPGNSIEVHNQSLDNEQYVLKRMNKYLTVQIEGERFQKFKEEIEGANYDYTTSTRTLSGNKGALQKVCCPLPVGSIIQLLIKPEKQSPK